MFAQMLSIGVTFTYFLMNLAKDWVTTLWKQEPEKVEDKGNDPGGGLPSKNSGV